MKLGSHIHGYILGCEVGLEKEAAAGLPIGRPTVMTWSEVRAPPLYCLSTDIHQHHWSMGEGTEWVCTNNQKWFSSSIHRYTCAEVAKPEEGRHEQERLERDMGGFLPPNTVLRRTSQGVMVVRRQDEGVASVDRQRICRQTPAKSM
jgi:hypothetical protein